ARGLPSTRTDGASTDPRGVSRRGASNESGSDSRSADRDRDTMREVSNAMQRAASELQRGASAQAGESASRALTDLRNLERRLQSPGDDDRRALGDARLDARQLADGQRQIASDLGRLPAGDAGAEALRRLSADQSRLADRMRRLEADLKQFA